MRQWSVSVGRRFLILLSCSVSFVRYGFIRNVKGFSRKRSRELSGIGVIGVLSGHVSYRLLSCRHLRPIKAQRYWCRMKKVLSFTCGMLGNDQSFLNRENYH